MKEDPNHTELSREGEADLLHYPSPGLDAVHKKFPPCGGEGIFYHQGPGTCNFQRLGCGPCPLQYSSPGWLALSPFLSQGQDSERGHQGHKGQGLGWNPIWKVLTNSGQLILGSVMMYRLQLGKKYRYALMSFLTISTNRIVICLLWFERNSGTISHTVDTTPFDSLLFIF